MDLPDCGHKELHFPKQPPLQMDEFHYTQSLIKQILHQDRCLHFPYYSFDHFLRLLQEAAISEEVTEIRISLYPGTPGNSEQLPRRQISTRTPAETAS